MNHHGRRGKPSRLQTLQRNFPVPLIKPSIRSTTSNETTNGSISPPASLNSSSIAPPPYKLDPPSYATIIRNGETSFHVTTMGAFPSDYLIPLSNMLGPNTLRLSTPFIVPHPPPSYAESEGLPEEDVEESELPRVSSQYGIGGRQAMCPFCIHIVQTNVQSHPTKQTHFTAILMCLFGCWPCCLFPYCLPYFQENEHYCPVCRELIFTVAPFGRVSLTNPVA